jgi:hypothetical protein
MCLCLDGASSPERNEFPSSGLSPWLLASARTVIQRERPRMGDRAILQTLANFGAMESYRFSDKLLLPDRLLQAESLRGTI